MTDLMEVEQLPDPEFKWAKKRGLGGKTKKIQFYESFTYDGLDYALYDCVYMHKQGEPAPYIGKLVKIWETAEGTKKIKVHWFFRPSEISSYLKDAKVSENELFLASGDGKGLFNLNPLEAIAGKCNVVCTSTDSRNPQPSAKELQMADYVFYRIFDVTSCTISDQMDDKIGGLEVNFVFNRREGAETLDTGEKNELSVVAFKEIPETAGNISPQELNNTILDKKGNHALEKEDTQVMQVPVKQGSLDGKHCSVVDVTSKKMVEITGTILEEKTTTGANICEKKDKFKDKNIPVTQIYVKKGVKHARKSADIDDASSKRARVDGPVSPDLNGVQSVKDSVAYRKDVPVSEKSSPLVEKQSKTVVSLSKDASRSGHVDDDVGYKKKAKLNKNPNALQGKMNAISSSEKEKLGSTPRKDSLIAQKDKKLGGNLSSSGEKTSANNVVSRDATPRPSTSNVSPKEIPKSIPNKELERSLQVAKPAESLSLGAWMERPLETTNEESKKHSKLDHDKSHENNDKKSGSNSCSKDDGHLKKAKVDNSINGLDENKDNVVTKLEKKPYVGEARNSLTIATFGDNYAKSRLVEGTSKMSCNEKEKNHVGETKLSPNSLTCNNEAKSKLGKRSFMEYHNQKDGKLSNDNLPNRGGTKSKNDGGKVGDNIIEVARRPREKATWIKLPWEQQMKTAHDQDKLVLLQNLDPEYTSGEVEDIMWHVFREHCTARMLPQTAISNPYLGQALVVFKSKAAADKVVHKLDEKCLMLPNQRPLVACHAALPKHSEKQTTHVGHLSTDRDRRLMLREWKDAVSTSHYSQNNTIEYELALEWCLLHARSDKWWKNLYEQHQKELERHAVNLKSK